MSKGGGNTAAKLGLGAIVGVIAVVGLSSVMLILLMKMIIMELVNPILCSKVLGYFTKYQFCETAQVKYDPITEQELMDIGEAMKKLREESNETEEFSDENGEVVNPSELGTVKLTFNGEEREESEGSVFIRALMATDDMAIEKIDLSDKAIEERFDISVDDVTRATKLGEKTEEGGGGGSIVSVDGSTTGVLPTSKEGYLEVIGPIAQEVSCKNDLYGSVMIAQSILESSWGQSKLSKPPNHNLFGVKGSYKGQTTVQSTQEFTGTANAITIDAGFRKYPDYESSITDHADLLKNGLKSNKNYYKKAWRSQASSPKEAVTAIRAAGYATDANYVSLIMDIIAGRNLTKYDDCSGINTNSSTKTKADTEEKKEKKTSMVISEQTKHANEKKEDKTKEEKNKNKEDKTKEEDKNKENEDNGEEKLKLSDLKGLIKGKKVMVDAGHGGSDGGNKKTADKNYIEKDFNLKLANALKEKLEIVGATVEMTRTSDEKVTNKDRKKQVNAKKPNYFISVHANGNDKETQGTKTIYADSKAKDMATKLQAQMVKAWGFKDLGVEKKEQHELLNGVKNSTMGVHLETGYIDYDDDFKMFFQNEEKIELMAARIAIGMLEYEGVEVTPEIEKLLTGKDPDDDSSESNEPSASTGNGKKYNNFLTVWFMARTLEDEYAKFKNKEETPLEAVFDDIIDSRAEELKYDREDWMKSVQMEAYMCYFVGEDTSWWKSALDFVGFKSLKRVPCNNLDDIYEITFSERIEFIPKDMQGVMNNIEVKEVTRYKCEDDWFRTVATKDKCNEPEKAKEIKAKEKVLKFAESGDIIGGFAGFTIYEPGVSMGKDDDSWEKYLEEAVFRDMYNLDYDVKPFYPGQCNSSGTYDSAGGSSYSGKYADLINKLAKEAGVSPALIAAIVRKESSFNPNAVSSAGAKGLMQLMPDTSRAMGVKDPTDPEDNLRGGIKYIKQMLKEQNNNLTLALAAYNAGPGNVQTYGGVPPFPETQTYVVKVQKYYEEYKLGGEFSENESTEDEEKDGKKKKADEKENKKDKNKEESSTETSGNTKTVTFPGGVSIEVSTEVSNDAEGKGKGRKNTQPFVDEIMKQIEKEFDVIDYHGWRSTGKYDGSKSEHNSGYALDIIATPEVMKKIAEYGRGISVIQYAIYNNQISSHGGDWKSYGANAQNKKSPHTDHVHLDFKLDDSKHVEGSTGGCTTSSGASGDASNIGSNISGAGAAMGEENFKKLYAEAEKHLGKQYVWGSSPTNPSTFDCSSYTSYVFKTVFGKQFPRTSGEQQKALTKINEKDVTPGDLVFFSGNGGKSVTHVAIYIGDGKIIHASGSGNKGKVNIAKIKNGYWDKRIYSYGRVNID